LINDDDDDDDSLPDFITSANNGIITSANNTNMFKCRLDNSWKNQDIKYDFKNRIEATALTFACTRILLCLRPYICHSLFSKFSLIF